MLMKVIYRLIVEWKASLWSLNMEWNIDACFLSPSFGLEVT
jgi:hypothetical protein